MSDPDLPAPEAVRALIHRRWSPRAFTDRPVAPDILRDLFEAARWAPSSFNEQPWRFLVATKAQPETFEKVASCLNEKNRRWAPQAPVLVLTVVRTTNSRTGKPNPHARHDLGLAIGALTVLATAYGLHLHQMAGILPDRAREVFSIPEEYEVVTAIALGYAGSPEHLPDDLAEKERERRTNRQRRPLSETVFSGKWGEEGLGV